ncbi:DEAD/DEAH box helicase [Rothia mucilaginosa]|uniref:DEAD/DEAH box helicase n=1 Tax=Rothia mucilaginosa TaxID=43675 RepID=UPI00066CF435|nr:type ISP restriction/modification enzyme [Rothia mucilaginosa]
MTASGTPADVSTKTSMAFDNLLHQLRTTALHTRDQGDRLERLTKEFLTKDSIQSRLYKKVYLWKDWDGRENFGDIGIDLVAENVDGGVTAIQCKFYDEHSTIAKEHIDSFISASGRKPFTHRIIVSTTDKWSKNAEKMLEEQRFPVQRMGLQTFRDSNIDWSTYSLDDPGEQQVGYKPHKELRPHQDIAITRTLKGLQKDDRGQLIMACGTGKTFTAIRLAEKFAEQNGGHARVLFMVPSLALMSQSISEFSNEIEGPFHAYAVCSDSKVGREKKCGGANADLADLRVEDLQLPATTDGAELAAAMNANPLDEGLEVVFSTYHSIDAVSEAQAAGVGEFDLIICDEAHRTTGVTLADESESNFVKIHDDNWVAGRKRVYMTATPKIFNEDTKFQASEKAAVLCSMDDMDTFGPVFYRIGFGEAVEKGLLTDYKVLVLGVSESQIATSFQNLLADESNELAIDDVAKLVGCWNGLAKRRSGELEASFGDDLAPMKRAVAFSRSIKDSQKIEREFEDLVRIHLRNRENDDPTDDLGVQVRHIDGGFNAQSRAELLNWLKQEPNEEGPICRILTNARCLTEGVDVPNLDAVLFLNPRNSMVDVIQAVGRVMRRAEGKKYGYIILPIAIPDGMSTAQALSDNKRYKVVWQVLQALRAHDERMDATIHQIELNASDPESIIVQTVDLAPKKEKDSIGANDTEAPEDSITPGEQTTLTFPAQEWKDGVYAKIVDKVGTREYWDDWSKDIATIAGRHITMIRHLLDEASPESELRTVFAQFVEGLQQTLNPAIDEDQAIEMLAQHLITQPVFDAMFAGHRFTELNPISLAMQNVVDHLNANAAFEKERESLSAFYESVQRRVKDLDNAAAKQHVIKDLYDKFFQNAFPRIAERLGIVFTPVPVVDYILRSADAALRESFGKSLSDEGVSVIEPFVGTGTFITRLLQLGLIRPEDLERKYTRELFANEIVLLSYYIAAINIETVYGEVAKEHGLGSEYVPFNGMVLTDTFQLSESSHHLNLPAFRANSERAERELERDIRVIVMNPPYSAGQNNANDNNQNEKYPKLDERIAETYAKNSSGTNKNSIYDSYIRAIRWASDRVKDSGVIAFVSNGSFIDGNAADGLRKCLVDEFSKLYVYNLRGNQRTSGEQSRREGGKIFGSGSRTPVAICVLVKDPSHTDEAVLHYRDIGDYLSREEKLDIIAREGSIAHTEWEVIVPNEAADWINQRDEKYDTYQPIGDRDTKGKPNTPGIFQLYSRGLATSRDAWVYNFSARAVEENVRRMIEFYNSQIGVEHPDMDPTKIAWGDGLKSLLRRKIQVGYSTTAARLSVYRPFCKQHVYFDAPLNERQYQLPKLFPTPAHENIAFGFTGRGATKEFSVLMVDTLPDLESISKAQWMSLYTYEPVVQEDGGFNLNLGGGEVVDGYTRKENITDATLAAYRSTYGDEGIAKEDIFYYIYALLHHPEYREKYAADLKKMLPRIPLVKGFWEYSRTGRALAELHLGYESVEPYPLDEVASSPAPEDLEERFEFYRVQKLQFGPKKDKTRIKYNGHLTLKGIPEEAYEYQVNGRSALEWVIDRYQVKTDKKSLITNDPNDYCRAVNDPRYIVDLIKRLVTVSLETQKLVGTLPRFEVLEDNA